MPEPTFPLAEHIISQAEQQRVREQIFGSIVISHILGEFSDALEQVGYEQEDVDAIKRELAALSEEDQKAALALPEEIRVSYLERLKDKSPSELVRTLVENGQKHGFTLGYHVSPFQMQGQTILGQEIDHRDNDLPRAYYSTDYKHLFLKKGGNNLYAVRAETGEHSSHRRDNNGSWGRAFSLAIVSRFDLAHIRAEVEAGVRNYERMKKEEAAGKKAAA